MNLPPGNVVLEKKITRTERVGLDDFISKDLDCIVFVPEGTAVFQLYNKETGELVGEFSLMQLLESVKIEAIDKNDKP